MICHMCDQPAVGQCIHCGKFYCRDHQDSPRFFLRPGYCAECGRVRQAVWRILGPSLAVCLVVLAAAWLALSGLGVILFAFLGLLVLGGLSQYL